MTYGKQTLIAVDQLINTLFMGWPDETLSSRCWRWEQAGIRVWPRKLVDGLFFWQREPARAVMRDWFANSVKILLKTPSLLHLTNRLYSVLYGPYSAGASFH